MQLHVFRSFIFWLVLLFSSDVMAALTPIHLASGPRTGTHFAAAKQLCRLVNHDRNLHGVYCRNLVTPGSIFNKNALMHGEADFGFVQADLLCVEEQSSKDVEKLQSVISLYDEPYTVVVTQAGGIREFEALRGRTLGLGLMPDNQLPTLKRIVAELGWKMDDVRIENNLTLSEQLGALCSGQINALLSTVRHPDATLRALSYLCPVRIVPIPERVVKRFLRRYQAYTEAVIDKESYPFLDHDIRTLGVRTNLVARAGVPDEHVSALLDSLLSQPEMLEKIDPRSGLLSPEKIVQGSVLPFNKVAQSVFEARNLMAKTQSPCS